MVLADLGGALDSVSASAIGDLHGEERTAHLPVIAYGAPDDFEELEEEREGRLSGDTLVVTDVAVLTHLDQLMERALHID